MPIFDIVLLLLLASFVLYGFYLGLVRMVLGLISTVLSIIISLNLYLYFYDWVWRFENWSANTGKIVSFIVVLLVVNLVLNFVFKIVAKILKLITSLPLISFLNGSLGGVLGLIQGLLIVGIIIFVSVHYLSSESVIGQAMVASEITPIFLRGIAWLEPLVPEAWQVLQTTLILR